MIINAKFSGYCVHRNTIFGDIYKTALLYLFEVSNFRNKNLLLETLIICSVNALCIRGKNS